jgi:hypothetical protein
VGFKKPPRSTKYSIRRADIVCHRYLRKNWTPVYSRVFILLVRCTKRMG